MSNCQLDNDCIECIERLRPQDPRQPFYISNGQYLKPLCYHCRNYSLHIEEQPEVKEEKWTRRQWDTVNQLRAGFIHVHKDVMECLQKVEEIRK